MHMRIRNGNRWFLKRSLMTLTVRNNYRLQLLDYPICLINVIRNVLTWTCVNRARYFKQTIFIKVLFYNSQMYVLLQKKINLCYQPCYWKKLLRLLNLNQYIYNLLLWLYYKIFLSARFTFRGHFSYASLAINEFIENIS